MEEGRVDLDSLIGGWRAALEAEQAALRAGTADHDISGGDLRRWSSRLGAERSTIAGVLGELARDRYRRPRLARLLATSLEVKKLLGLPSAVEACVFNVDGVLVPSASFHAEAWKETFNELIDRWGDRNGVPIAGFSRRVDYPALVHGKSRTGAVRDFLASRGISLPEGRPDDPPGDETVHGLANRKNEALHRHLVREGVAAFDGARLYLQLARDARLPCAVVSGSTNTQALLERAGLTPLIDGCVDGNAARAEGLRRKPAPDMLHAACRSVGARPERTAVFETTRAGVAAGRTGGFELVVAVEGEGDAAALRAEGADRVVTDLGEILESALGA